jgi:hypothetical protein
VIPFVCSHTTQALPTIFARCASEAPNGAQRGASLKQSQLYGRREPSSASNSTDTRNRDSGLQEQIHLARLVAALPLILQLASEGGLRQPAT